MINFLNGSKTYLVAAVAAIGAFLQAMGLISQENWTVLIGILAPLFMITLRSALAKTEAVVVAQVATVERKVENVAPAVAQVAAQVAEVKAVVKDTVVSSLPHVSAGTHVILP